MSDQRSADEFRRVASRRKPELRLALAMRGGVSLAVWMGGACAEIDALRRAAEPPAEGGDDEVTAFWRELLTHSAYSRVVVDVIAGASAGGLNGVMFGAAIRHGFPMAGLQQVWRDVAGIDQLRRRGVPWRSLFDGDTAFLDVIDERLEQLTAAPSAAARVRVPAIDLQLTATLVEPVTQPATSPVDEALRRARSAARFHFRHDPDAVFPRADLEADGLARLAVAARGSASFPFAFEAAAVRSTRSPLFDLGPPPPPSPGMDRTARRFTDCRGIFSESRGAPGGRGGDLHDDDFVVADGGILDNIPIGRALEAIRRMPASGPTRRVLVYLHPTGPSLGGSESTAAESSSRDRRDARALLGGLIRSRLRGESIDEDLEQMEEVNRNLRLRRQARGAAAARVMDTADVIGAARLEIGVYRNQRAVVDADAVRTLLRDPLLVLGEDPFPVVAGPDGDDRWRAPLALWSPAHRLELDEVLRTTFDGRLGEREEALAPLLAAGLGPLARTVDLLTELALAIELLAGAHGEVGTLKAELYRLGSLIRELERIRRIGWVAAAGRLILPKDGDGPAPAPDAVAAWVTTTLDELNDLLRCDRSVAEALCGTSAVSSTATASARQAFLLGSNRGLQRLADLEAAGPGPEGAERGTGTPSDGRGQGPTDDEVDVRHVVIPVLCRVAAALVGHWRALPARAARGSDPTVDDVALGADCICRILHEGRNDEVVVDQERLAAVEVLLVREHLLGPSAGVAISFVRMSAAAPTIDAHRFERLHPRSTELDPDHTDDDHLLPDVKLAGNELSNFAAFIDERWRTNDWFWGRIDAVPTLVDLLLGLDRTDAGADVGALAASLGLRAGSEPVEVRRALVRRRQDRIVEDMAASAEMTGEEARRTWDVGLETLTVPGARPIRTSMARAARVATVVLGAAVERPRLAWVLQFPAGWMAGRYARPRGGSAGSGRLAGRRSGRRS